MQAAVWYGKNDIRLERRPIPTPGPGELLVQVAFCGICGTDVHAYAGTAMSRGYIPGHILGHEYSGTVIDVGAGVTTLNPGEQIVGGGGMACGKCIPCRNGSTYLCIQSIRNKEGAWAEYMAVPEGCVYPLPRDVSLEIGSMAEPVANVINTIHVSPLELGDTVLVTGAGTIGLLMTQVAQRRGASAVIVSEPNAIKRELAKEMGATTVVDPTRENLVDVVETVTGGNGVDLAIDAVGFPQVLKQCMEATRRGGTVFVHGLAGPEVEMTITPYDLFARLLTVRGITGLRWDKTLKLLGKLDIQPMITRHFPLSDIHSAFEFLAKGKGIKVLLVPSL